MGWDTLRAAVQRIATERGEIAGVPFPVRGIPIRVSSRHQTLGRVDGSMLPNDEPPRTFTCGEADIDELGAPRERNRWWSARLNTWIMIVDDPRAPGHVTYALIPHAVRLAAGRRWTMAMETMRVASEAWDAGPELRAMEKLMGLINVAQWRTYVTVGSFVERSTRSRAAYMFRRARPTLAMLPTGPEPGASLAPSCALCLHPIAYYEGTFAGGMVPTDDLIAHLLLMRADEHRLWKQANQHPIDRLEAGL